jgi:hypothetical protein
LLAHGRWFSLGIPASSTTKTGRHDIAEILLKVASKHQKSNQIKSNLFLFVLFLCIFSFFFFLLHFNKIPMQYSFQQCNDKNARIPYN